jgi:hypothetical protein
MVLKKKQEMGEEEETDGGIRKGERGDYHKETKIYYFFTLSLYQHCWGGGGGGRQSFKKMINYF